MLRVIAVLVAVYLPAKAFTVQGGLIGYQNGLADAGQNLEIVNGYYIPHGTTNPQALAGFFRELGFAVFFFVIGTVVKNKFLAQFLLSAALVAAIYSIYRTLTFEPIISVSS